MSDVTRGNLVSQNGANPTEGFRASYRRLRRRTDCIRPLRCEGSAGQLGLRARRLEQPPGRPRGAALRHK